MKTKIKLGLALLVFYVICWLTVVGGIIFAAIHFIRKLWMWILLAGLLFVSGCKDSQLAQFKALGKKHRITLYGCDGIVIKQWISTGNVSNQERSDGWYFEDDSTKRLVEVTGTLIIEVIP